MAGYDAEIRISTKIDNSQFYKGAEEVKKKVEHLEKQTKRTELSLGWNEQEAKRVEEQIDRILAKKKKLSQEPATSTDNPYLSREVDFDWEKNAQEMSRINAEIESFAVKAEQTGDKAAQADEHINQLRVDVEEYAGALKELENAGQYFGDADYDRIYLAWQNAKDAVKEYAAELNKQTARGQAEEAEKSARAMEKEAEAQRRIEEAAERNLQKENAKIEKEAQVQAKLQAQETAQRELQSIKQQAVVSDQNLVDLMEKQKRITEKITQLKKAGVTDGYAEYDGLQKELSQVNGQIRGARDGFSKVAKSSKKTFDVIHKGAKKSNGLLSTLKSRLKGITLSLLVFNWITKGFNAMVSNMKEGYKNLVQYSKKYNDSMSALMSAGTQLKNSFATAFAPLIELVMPYLLKFVSLLTDAANRVAQFTAALTGAKTWTKAIAVQQDYAGSLNGTADAANRAVKALAGFDELNVLGKQNETASGGGLKPSDMFTELEISNEAAKAADALIAQFDKLKAAVKPFTDAIKELWEGGLSKLGNFAWTGLKDFYNEFLVPLGTWAFGTENEGFTRLVNIINEDLNRIPWDTVNKNLKEFWTAVEPYAEQFGEGLIDFFEDVANVATDIFIFLFGEDGALVWMTDWLNGNDPEKARDWGYALGILATAIAGFVIASDIVNVIAKASELLKVLGGLEGIGKIVLTVTVAYTGFEVGKELGKLLFPKSDEFYDNFTWFGEDGFFDTIKNTDLLTLTNSLDAMLTDLQNNDLYRLITGTFIFPKKKTSQEIQDEFKELSNGIENWWDEDVAPWFMEETWVNLGENIKLGLSSKWTEFSEWWSGTGIPTWWSENVEPWFSKETWSQQWDSVKSTASTMWTKLRTWWDNSAIGKWWTESVEPWFSLSQWEGVLQNVPKAFKNAFEAAVEFITNIIEDLFGWIGDKFSLFNTELSQTDKGKYKISLNERSSISKSLNFPLLADGAVIQGGRPFAAILGDQRVGQTNVEAPLRTIQEALQNVINKNGNSNEINLNVYLDGNEVYKSVVKRDQMYCKQTGHSAFLF